MAKKLFTGICQQNKLFQSHIVCITELIGATGMVAKAHQCNLSSACIKSYQTFPPVLKVFQGDIQSWEDRAGFRFYEDALACLMEKRFQGFFGLVEPFRQTIKKA